MPTGVEAKIADLLLTHLGALTFTPAIPVSYPGVPFTPPEGTYLEATFIPNTNVNRFVGHDSTTEHRGILQVSVYAPASVGLIPPLGIAGKVVEHFERGAVIVDGTLRVRISGRPSVAAPIQEPDRVHIPVSVNWRAFA